MNTYIKKISFKENQKKEKEIIHIQKVVVYKQLLELESDFKSYMIWNLKPKIIMIREEIHESTF